MKSYFPRILALFILFSCNSNAEKQTRYTGREISFDRTIYDFGEMEEGSDGLYKIEFRNTGDSAIVINRVRSSCGCTIPSWPKIPLEPGDKGVIELRYNTALTGSFIKSVYVYSSADNSPVKLTVKGKVIPKDKI